MERIDEIISQKSLLKHPFYEAWNRGDLPRVFKRICNSVLPF